MNRDRHPQTLIRRTLSSAICFLAIFLVVVGALPAQEPPSRPNSGQAALGKSLFQTYCASCHGTLGRGDGQIAEYLTIKPADLTRLKKEGEFPFETIVKIIDGREKARAHGSSEMPIWGDAFRKLDENDDADGVTGKIHSLAHYLWSIQEGEGASSPDRR